MFGSQNYNACMYCMLCAKTEQREKLKSTRFRMSRVMHPCTLYNPFKLTNTHSHTDRSPHCSFNATEIVKRAVIGLPMVQQLVFFQETVSFVKSPQCTNYVHELLHKPNQNLTK